MSDQTIPDYSNWSRKQLQEEAKKFGIKANMKVKSQINSKTNKQKNHIFS